MQMVNIYRNALTKAGYKATKFLEMPRPFCTHSICRMGSRSFGPGEWSWHLGEKRKPPGGRHAPPEGLVSALIPSRQSVLGGLSGSTITITVSVRPHGRSEENLLASPIIARTRPIVATASDITMYHLWSRRNRRSSSC